MRKVLLGLFIGVFLNSFAVNKKGGDEDLEGLISRHLNSVGAEAARAAVKTRVAEGLTHYKMISNATVEREGKAALVSEGQKIRLLLRFSDTRYPGENFVTDGKGVEVYNLPRSGFGELVYSENVLLRDGLLGGVLTTAWPFFSAERRQAKLSYAGLKEIDGKKLHEIIYNPKKNTDVSIHLYFDPDTSRHVLSVYTVEVAPRATSAKVNDKSDARLADDATVLNPTVKEDKNSEVLTAHQQPLHYRLEERFGEFREVDGLNLPTEWKIQLTMEGYESAIIYWEVKFNRLENNLVLDPRNFPMK